MTLTKSIAIIGSGPGGSMAAYLLSKQGHQVTIYESKTQHKRKICGEYLCPAGVRLLQQLKLQFPQHFLPVIGMRLITPWQTQLIGDFPQEVNQTNVGVSAPRDEFDQWILQLAIGAGAQLKLGQLLTTAQMVNEKWCLNFQNQFESARCDLLIGADGRQSTVAKILGWEGGHDFSRLALHAYIPHQQTLERRGEMHLLGGGAYFGIDPVKSNELNVTLVLTAKQLRRFQNPSECMTHYWNNHPDLVHRFGPWNENYKLFSLAPINHRSKKICNRHAALIGDAAGLVDPLTGEGIYNALMSAYLLALSLEQDPQDWQQNYRRLYKQFMAPKIKLNRILQAVIKRNWTMALIERFLRARNDRTNHFIGLIGNVWTPLQALRKMI